MEVHKSSLLAVFDAKQRLEVGADVIYACWYILRLVSLPLFPVWSERVAPSIDQLGGARL